MVLSIKLGSKIIVICTTLERGKLSPQKSASFSLPHFFVLFHYLFANHKLMKALGQILTESLGVFEKFYVKPTGHLLI